MYKSRDTRELDKIGLETFLQDFEFEDLEGSLKDAIDTLDSEQGKVGEQYAKELGEKGWSHDMEYFYMSESLSIESKLGSIYEMIIVNDYKEFELVLKKLLKAALDIEEKDYRGFKDIKILLKDKGIKIPNLPYYNEMNDLRKVNNHIKHSISNENLKELQNIPEFRNEKNLTYEKLMLFHRRIKGLRIKFIWELKWEIYSYLYDYDEDRIKHIANRIIRRMSEKDIDLLIHELDKGK